MKKTLSDLMCKCDKVALSFENSESGKTCAVTVLGVGIVFALVLFHICAWKCHSMCACKKGQKEASKSK